MRYIKLFEAFQSDALSNVVKFLKKKVGKNESNRFLNSLISLKNRFDIKLDEISNDDVEYLNSKKALLVNKDEKFDNRVGIYCLKFWFSIEYGFIGYTGVGNFKYKDSNDELINESDIEYIKNDMDIKTGILKKAEFSKLKDGDEILFYADNYREDNSNWVKATILIDNGVIYAIHNNPNVSGGYPEADFSNLSEYLWILGSINNQGDEYILLYSYTPNNNDLVVNDIVNNKEESTFEFNLPFSNGNELRNWSKYKEDEYILKKIVNSQLFGWEK